MLSSGVINLTRLIGGWACGLAILALTVVHFDEIRSAFGLKLDPEDFGIVASQPARSETEVRTVIEYVEREPVPRPGARRQGSPVSQRDEPLFTQGVQLVRGRDGHFHADATINGRTIPVLVDTGATLVALSYEDAMAAGVSVGANDFRYVSSTANGQAKFARVTLDQVRIGTVVVHNVAAAVSQPGRLETTLLGMSFLGQLRMEMKGGLLTLEQ